MKEFGKSSMENNLKKIDSEELKKIQIQILDVVDDFCNKNKIKYWINAGTLLGAIRHGGYIPWDDDIDLGMLREDFDKFIYSFNDENDKYKVYCFENNDDFYYPFAKVLDTDTVLYEPDEKGSKLSVNIDIFVYDNAPDDIRKLKKQFIKRDLLRRCVQTKLGLYDKKSKIKVVMYSLFYVAILPFSTKKLMKKMISNQKKYNNVNTNLVGDYTGYYRVVIDKKSFQKTIKKKFEGKEYNAPIGYDKWLTTLYGDYMKLPPKEKQVTHHVFKAYYKKSSGL